MDGYPAELFHEINEKRFHLIPIQEKSITEFYIASTIPASAYSWQNISVSTVTTRAILITYDYKGNNCANVRNFAKVIYENLDWLKKYGHPKWKNTDFDSPIRNWDQYGCVKMQRPLNSTTSDQSLNELKKHIMDAVKDMNK